GGGIKSSNALNVARKHLIRTCLSQERELGETWPMDPQGNVRAARGPVTHRTLHTSCGYLPLSQQPRHFATAIRRKYRHCVRSESPSGCPPCTLDCRMQHPVYRCPLCLN